MDLFHVSLASLVLDSSTGANVVCGSNGLPLTPNSIKIIGDFKAQVEHVDHPNLTKYVECFRNKKERVTLVFEHPTQPPPARPNLKSVAKSLLDALNYMHNSINCTHGLITSECLVWNDNQLKLAHWPINLLAGGGFALGAATILPENVSYVAPELVRAPGKQQATQQSDIWSAGLALLKLIKTSIKIPDNPCRLAFCDSPQEVLQQLDGHLDESLCENPTQWNSFFARTLDPNPSSRATLSELYSILELEQPHTATTIKDYLEAESPITTTAISATETQTNHVKGKPQIKLDISEVYYLWRISLGRNFESEQKHDGYPPIFEIPYLIVTESQIAQSDNEVAPTKLKSHIIIDTQSKPIPLEKFKSDIMSLDKRIFQPLLISDDELINHLEGQEMSLSSSTSETNIITDKECNGNKKISHSFTFADLDDLATSITDRSQDSSKTLPVIIKEADFAYQCERIVLFKRLLAAGPLFREYIKRETAVDIPPYYRAEAWAILLNVSQDESERLYEKIDKTTPVATDRQISVDIPRCHQYNLLMASPQGHQKLARILKAWLNHNSKDYVYWQGLDSLAAPFLLLNFDNEAMAFACFDAFVNKYLRGFFKKDNQLIVQQYLSMFSELLNFHDPSLASHLKSLGFLPNLYAIPWFLTMFTHVLPLHKILHVWDCLLLGDERFSLCIGVAILYQLKSELMEYSFNDCIVAFSDLPEIDIERCIKDASHIYNSTPESFHSPIC